MSQIDSNHKSRATSGQYGLSQVPQENGIKRCGYCDMLVRWTTSSAEDGGSSRNVAVNSDGSLHQCLANGTAKRRDPVKHGRPTATEEVISFLNAASKHREGSAAGPAAGAGGSASANIAAQQSLPNHHQQQQEQLQQPAAPVGNDASAAATQQQRQQPDRDAAIRAMREANIAAWKAQAEATGCLADAMVKVARSADALVKVASDLATSNYRLSSELAKLTGLIQGIVADAAATRRDRGATS